MRKPKPQKKRDLKIATSFDLTDGIDSRAVDRDLKKYTDKYGATKYSPQDLEQIRKNIKTLRSKLRGV